MNIPDHINQLTHRIIGACMEVHNELGPGFPEEYYQKALELEFGYQDLPFEPQKAVQVLYKGTQVGLNYLDFVIDETIILEIKTTNHLTNVHKFQVIKYFAATNYDIALLVNFGRVKLQFERLLPPKNIQGKRKSK